MERWKEVQMGDEMRDLTGQKGTSQMDLISSYPMLPLAPNIATVAILSRAKNFHTAVGFLGSKFGTLRSVEQVRDEFRVRSR